MRKILPAIFFLLLAAGMANAQSTTVSGQVTDAAAQSWNNGTVVFTFVPNPQIPSGYTWTGGALNTTISGTLNGSGAYSISLPSNTAISPIGSKWQALVCSQASSPCFTTQPVTVTGSTQTLNVTPPAISISLTTPTSSPVLAYSDSEINSANLGSFYYSLPNQTFRVCQAVSGQVCTLFANIGTGTPTGFPRLDQVTDPNIPKTFNIATSLTLTGGALDFSGATKLAIPNIAGGTGSATAQLFLDTTNSNVHLWNGADNFIPLFPVASPPTSGDVVGFLLTGGKWTLQDLGPLNSSSGTTIVKADITNIVEGDSLCWDATAMIFVNCTPGVPPIVISGTTYNYDGTGSAAPERGEILFFTNAAGAALSLPQPSASTAINANWFTFIKADGGTLTLTAGGTGIFFDNGTDSITIPKGQGCSIFSDPSGVGTYYTKCAMVPLTAGSGVTITPAAYSIAIAATGSGGTITGSGTANTMTKFTGSAAVGNSSCTDDGSNPTRCPDGSNTATNGNYEEYTVDTGGVSSGLALCVTSNVDGSGRPKVLACSHVAAQPGAGFVGIARTTVAAAGTVAVCWTVNCFATFDNTSVALNEAILSVTTDGQMHDTGAQTATAGQPNFAVLNANSGTGTNALISLTGMLAQNPAGGGNGGKGTQVQVNGTNTKNNANFASGGGITVSGSASGATTTVTMTESALMISISDIGPLASDDGLILVIDPALAIHLTRLACGVSGSTSVVVNMVKGGNSLIADQTCTTGSVETVTTTTFVNGSGQCGGTSSCAIATHAPVTLHIGTVSGTPTGLQVAIEGTPY